MGLVDERFRGMNAKQVFDILREEKGKGGSGGSGGNGISDPSDDELILISIPLLV